MAELRADMFFDPAKINVKQTEYECEHLGRKSVCVTTEVCFIYSVKSDKQNLKNKAGETFWLFDHCGVIELFIFFPFSSRLL